MEKRNFNNKRISKLQLEDDSIITNDKNILEEVFIEPSKLIKVWTNKSTVNTVLKKCGIEQFDKLDLVGFYPRVTYIDYPGSRIKYKEVIKDLIKENKQ